MTAFDVTPHRSLPNYLVTTKGIDFKKDGTVTAHIETPTRALPVGTLLEGENFSDDSRGICEYHIEVSTSDFENFGEGQERVNIEPTNLDGEVHDGEIAIAIIEYTGSMLFSIDAAENLIKELAKRFDLLTCPLMTEQIDEIDIDDNPENYNRFVENTETFLDAAKRVNTEVSVLGTLPVIPWSRIEEESGLIDLYLKHKVEGFCVDFLDKKPTAKTRVERWISPFTKRLASEGLHRTAMLYAVNANRGSNRSGTPGSPAEDFYAFGLGFDILGGRYYSSRGGWPDDDVIRFRCFDGATFEQLYVALDDLANHLPDNSGFDHRYVLELAEDRAHRPRLQDLLEAEQMALAYKEIMKAVHADLGTEYLRRKAGTLGRIEVAMKTAKDAYNEGSSNPSISAF